ncbi:pantoate--beta-alanine ligase [Marinobacterium sediminicola]|uniref:Pantothenate synthetase n=1 Tax=Marinobacterium sediminicola TaxID=518898 RepID=A0ABY1S3N7_9GAMM|nr:pantoate--beta-alanine ligase [Marinobacterium sediminicola]ULG68901.1 pantoate--beta-alanine ligase [Marinobacterium sediminicola]SMR77897.1 pantothenate synthetase [Marinobacterium sediminicola]
MQTLHTIAELRAAVRQHRQAGKRIALVPTMGNLHQGHLRLVETALQQADVVITSIFVNPLQFGANEDLDSYPRTLAEDQQHLAAAGCHLVFAPSVAEVYPEGQEQQTLVEVPGLSDLHCGASRPGHFRGVTTVVCKLFNMVQPDIAVFGLKDYQQVAVIRKMVRDLCIPVDIIGVPTERADNGLALSSRNGYLTPEELALAPLLQRTLQQTATAIRNGAQDFSALEDSAQSSLEAAGFRRDYFRILNRDTLKPALPEDDKVILAAAFLGRARLIDNIEI